MANITTRAEKLFEAEFELRSAATEFVESEDAKWTTPTDTRMQRNLRRKRLREAALSYAALVDSYGLHGKVP